MPSVFATRKASKQRIVELSFLGSVAASSAPTAWLSSHHYKSEAGFVTGFAFD
jgi:hypothetical protein